MCRSRVVQRGGEQGHKVIGGGGGGELEHLSIRHTGSSQFVQGKFLVM